MTINFTELNQSGPDHKILNWILFVFILLLQGKENLGMVMVFTLVSAGQEWLNEKWDRIKKEKEERVLAKLKADEEAELVCTTVNVIYM